MTSELVEVRRAGACPLAAACAGRLAHAANRTDHAHYLPISVGIFPLGGTISTEIGVFRFRRPTAHCRGMDIRQLAQLARQHHGAIHREDTGASTSSWYRAHDSGLLVGVHPNVARLAGTFETRELRIAAAALAVGPDAIASHRSSAHLWGIPRPDDDPVDLIVTGRGSARRYEGVVLHRPNDQADLRPSPLRQGIRCTPIVRMLLDLGAVDRPAVRGAVGHLLALRAVTLEQLHTAVIEHSEHGRHGIVALRDALDEWTLDGRPADSVLEVAMHRLVRRADLPPVEFHPIIEGWEIDFRIVDTNVLIECDGWTYHGLDRLQFERDRQRDAELAAAGWVTLRFTYRSIIRTPFVVAARIRSVLGRQAA